MRKVVFVAPFFKPATVRFIQSVAKLEEIRLGLISCDSPKNLGDGLRARIGHHAHVGNCMDAGQLAIATRRLYREMGGIDVMFGALEEMQVPIARVRDFLDIPGLRTEAAINFRDKARMKSVLRANDVPCARHCLVTNGPEALAFVHAVGFPVIVKPPAGAGARGTFQIENEAQLRDYLGAYKPDPRRPTLFEEFIKGEEYSFESISIHGNVVWSSLTRYYPSPLEVLENPWIQWCVLLPREVEHPRFENIRAANDAALKALGMGTGLSHMEWFRRTDGSVAISEVGARPPGAQIMSLMSYATDKNFYDAWAELMVFHRFHAPERRYAAGAAYLRGTGRGKVKAVHGLDRAQKELGSVVMEARLPQRGQARSSSYEGEGYVIVRHPETEVVKKVLHRLVSLIRVEYE
ncbi:MAG: ATP-grasp domain-containing protein [Acidobacteriota bacterium]|nr:ATP-grasp domain-containing protein [Acidobacteriota bacterium]